MNRIFEKLRNLVFFFKKFVVSERIQHIFMNRIFEKLRNLGFLKKFVVSERIQQIFMNRIFEKLRNLVFFLRNLSFPKKNSTDFHEKDI